MSAAHTLRTKTYVLIALMVCFGPTGDVLLGKGMKQVGALTAWAPAQLAYFLLQAISNPTVWLGIIPLGGNRRKVLPREGFIMFDEELVSVELISGVLSVSQPREIAMYVRDFTDLAGIAVSGTAARDLITAALEDLA